MIGIYNYGTGRRKSAVARVFMKKGTGQFVVNEKPLDEFFTRELPPLSDVVTFCNNLPMSLYADSTGVK